MLKSKIENKVNELINGEDLLLVDVKITPQQKIMVFIDGTQNNVTIEQCVIVSRQLEAYLEEEQLVGEKYILEVSSPGMDYPFKVIQQYHKSIGRELEVLKKDGIKLEGVLLKVEEDYIQIEQTTQKKGKIIDKQIIEVPFEEIKATTKLITFK